MARAPSLTCPSRSEDLQQDPEDSTESIGLGAWMETAKAAATQSGDLGWPLQPPWTLASLSTGKEAEKEATRDAGIVWFIKISQPFG